MTKDMNSVSVLATANANWIVLEEFGVEPQLWFFLFPFSWKFSSYAHNDYVYVLFPMSMDMTEEEHILRSAWLKKNAATDHPQSS